MRNLPHIFSRTFNTPLLIQPRRMEPLIAGLREAALVRGSTRPTRRLHTARARLLRRYRGESPLEDRDDEPAAPLDVVDDDDLPRLPELWFDTVEEMPGTEDTWDYVITSGGVAWLPVQEVLVRRDGEIDADSTYLESYAHIGRVLRACLNDARVQGVLLDIDSPGGEAGGLFQLCDDIRALADVKPVWAVANDDCLSAAYGIAAAADRVWVSETGGVGSVGVIACHCDQSGFDADEGLRFDYVYAGEHKADFNPHQPMTPGAREALQEEVDRIYERFTEQVADHRGLSAEDVAATEAAIFYGENAVAAGLADEVGTLAEAIAALEDVLAAETVEDIMTTEPEAEQQPDPLPAPMEDELVTTARARPAAPAPRRVVPFDAARTASSNARRDAAEIAQLCNHFGYPGATAEFIAKRTSLAAVRAELQRRRASASEARRVEAIDTTQTRERPAQSAAAEIGRIATERFRAHATGKRS